MADMVVLALFAAARLAACPFRCWPGNERVIIPFCAAGISRLKGSECCGHRIYERLHHHGVITIWFYRQQWFTCGETYYC